ncbi:MAG: glycosyltransferase [Janthinobacterium lividum]
MKIVFVNSLYAPNGAAGAETTLRLLASSLKERGHDCSVVTLSPASPASTGTVDGIPIFYLPLANVYWPWGSSRPKALRPVFQFLEADNPVMRRRLSAILEQIRPDVMHAHNLQGFSASAWTAAARLGIPIVQTLHDYYAACVRSAMWRPARGNCTGLCTECRLFSQPRRRLSRLPQAVTCVSRRMFDRLHNAGAFPDAGTARQPVVIIRGNNARDALPAAATWLDGPLRLGFLGRLDQSKGLENLIAAVKRMSPDAATLRIAGSGLATYVDDLRRVAAGAPNITFVGHVDPAEFFPTLDLLVVPSVWEEPLGRVFHEALAYGVPSLASPLGGLAEAIIDGQTGFVLADVGSDALFERLHVLATVSWNREAMSEACRAAAAAYAPTRIARQYEAVLEAVVAGRPIPADAGDRWNPREEAA